MNPRLRADLRIARTSPATYVVYDPATGESATFGGVERHLLHLLDGERSPEEVRARFERRQGVPLARRTLEEFLEQLRRLGWLAGEGDARRAPARVGVRRPPRLTNRALDVLVVLFGWLLHPAWIPVVVALTVLAGVGMARHFGRFWAQVATIVENLPLPLLIGKLLLAFVSITFYRALVLGMACRKFGGSVLELRIGFLHSLLPYTHCDPGDWAISMSRRGKVTMIFGRFWAKLAAWSVLALGWLAVPERSTLSAILALYTFHFAIGIAFQTIVFLKTDTYGMLSWWLRVPSLWERSTAEVRAWLSFRRSPEALSSRERFWMRLYGLGALATQTLLYALVVGGGFWLFVRRFGGSGAWTFTVAVAWWFLEPRVRRWARSARRDGPTPFGSDEVRDEAAVAAGAPVAR